MKVVMEQDILQENSKQAEINKTRFGDTLVVNIIGSPGCGKTTLLEKTMAALSKDLKMAVIEGDVYTTRDAERIENCGVPVVQINTAGGCHISADAIALALNDIDAQGLDLLIIENVGNLVCPAEFDLGEDHKIAVLSTVEGDDKPVKYPLLFQEASLAIINKLDLLPYTNFNMYDATNDIFGINPEIDVIPMAAVKEEGLEEWFEWLREGIEAKKNK